MTMYLLYIICLITSFTNAHLYWLLFKVSILKSEFCFLSLAPSSFIVKVHICALFVVVCDLFGFLMPLKPCEVLLVVPPRLFLQLTCSKVLLIGALLIVENEEQCIRVEFLKDGGCFKDGQW